MGPDDMVYELHDTAGLEADQTIRLSIRRTRLLWVRPSSRAATPRPAR